MSDVIATAIRIALDGHAGQVDKAGKPYLTHPARVAVRVRAAGGSDEAVAAAWLHDVVEDTPWNPARLWAEGVPMDVVLAVWRLTRKPGESPDAYYAAIRGNAIALAVKAADVADNSDEGRLHYLPPATQARLRAKYAHARTALGLDEESPA